MCKFFSFVGDGYGNYLYSDWDNRRKILEEKSNNSPDSHTWILTYNKIPATMQDRWSKYEYNPLTKKFTIDEPVEGQDHKAAENWVNSLNFKNVIPALIIKPIVNPLKGKAKKVTEKEIKLLHEWDSVRNSVRNSVWYSVRDSVGNSVWDSVGNSVWDSVGASVRASVWDSVGNSVWDSVRDSVWDSVGNSVWASVGNSVWDSVGASVWAYMSSFFDIEYKHDFSSLNKLWNSGFVPSVGDKKWRLHSGKTAEIVYEWEKE